MKCQRCDKPATFHITELSGGKPQELHLCEEHARGYLTEATDDTPPEVANLAGMLAQVGETAEELARLEQKTCPVCGISFLEFRKLGRLGCPNDYEHFREELDPLLMNIHGETEHVGKVPRRCGGDSKRQTDLIRLRREMKEAVVNEQYERASELRDEIRNLEEQQ